MIDFKHVIWIGALLAVLGIGYSIHNDGVRKGIAIKQVELDDYKAGIGKQTAKARTEAIRIKNEQDAKYEKAKSDYRRDTIILAERLRDYEGMLCGEGQDAVRVDERSASGMSTQADSAARIVDAFATPAGARPTFKYNDAIMDTQQCSRLISFVKAM